MRPEAILAAAIEVLEEQAERPGPLDLILGRYQRARRYIGAKDRAALSERLYGVARRQARLDWRIEQAGGAPTPRLRAIADLLLVEGVDMDAIASWFDGAGYGPKPLQAEEWRTLAALGGPPLEMAGMPEATALECPDWAWPGFQEAFGPDAGEQLRALQAAAPLDFRVNLLKASREQAMRSLAADGFEAAPTPYSPVGLRLAGRVALGRLSALREGAIEPQDEGSQLAALALGAVAGERVADFCAGAGGKTLALAAAMRNKGQILALDIDGRRLKRAGPRFAKAGVDNVRTRPIRDGSDSWLKRQKGRFDRVLVDAPCSGVGAWRRNPDARWSRGQPALAALTEMQTTVLARAARLVRPGGLLVYVTCSLLPEENERQVDRFLEQNGDFGFEAPEGFPIEAPEGRLTLTPARHGVDGFFIAWLRRSGTPG